MSKDPAAVSLGKKRWKGKSEEEKTAHALLMNEGRSTKTTPEERSAAASVAAKARWANAKKKPAGKTGAKKNG